MERQAENTALRNATSPTGSENTDWMKTEAKYQVTMRIIRNWLDGGIITKEEFTIIDTKMKAKYRPKIGSLLFG